VGGGREKEVCVEEADHAPDDAAHDIEQVEVGELHLEEWRGKLARHGGTGRESGGRERREKEGRETHGNSPLREHGARVRERDTLMQEKREREEGGGGRHSRRSAGSTERNECRISHLRVR